MHRPPAGLFCCLETGSRGTEPGSQYLWGSNTSYLFFFCNLRKHWDVKIAPCGVEANVLTVSEPGGCWLGLIEQTDKNQYHCNMYGTPWESKQFYKGKLKEDIAFMDVLLPRCFHFVMFLSVWSRCWLTSVRFKCSNKAGTCAKKCQTGYTAHFEQWALQWNWEI